MLTWTIEVIAEYDEPGDSEGDRQLHLGLMDWASGNYGKRIVDELPNGWITACIYTVQAATEEAAAAQAVREFASEKFDLGIAGPRTTRAVTLPPED